MIKNKKITILLILIIILGGGIRLYNLGKEPLTYDELLNLNFFKDRPSIFILDVAQDRQMPLNLIIGYLWIRVFGINDFSLRYPSFIFGLIAIFMIYLLAKKIFNNKVGLLAAFLLAFNQSHIRFSQSARGYSLFFLLGIFSVYYFMKILKDPKPLHFKLYLITTVLMVFSHPLSIAILLFQNIYFFIFIKNKNLMKKWILFQLLLFLIILPWIIFMINTEYKVYPSIRHIGNSYCPIIDRIYTLSVGGPFLATITDIGTTDDIIDFFFNHNFFDLFYFGIFEYVFFIFLVSMLIYSLFILSKRKKRKLNYFWFLTIWFCFAFITKFFIVAGFYPNPSNCDGRYFLIALAPFIILVSFGIYTLFKKYKILFVFLIFFILPISLLTTFNYHKYYSKIGGYGQYWQLGQFIPENATNKEIGNIKNIKKTNKILYFLNKV